MITYSAGYTLDYLIHAVIVTAAGGAAAAAFSSDGLPIFLIAVLPIALLLLTAKGGLEMDSRNRRIRQFHSLLGLKWGKWMPYRSHSEVRLITYKETRQIGGLRARPSSVRSQRTFELWLHTDDHSDLLFEFLEYEDAMECFNILSSSAKIKVVNKLMSPD